MEGGYLSNQREARNIADPAYRQKMAEAVARALVEDSGGTADYAGSSTVNRSLDQRQSPRGTE